MAMVVQRQSQIRQLAGGSAVLFLTVYIFIWHLALKVHQSASIKRENAATVGAMPQRELGQQSQHDKKTQVGIALSLDNVTRVSSVDYMACCGLGHRISKTADANYLAHHLNFGLRSFWGYCEEESDGGRQIEVYHHLFGPEPVRLDQKVSKNPSYNLYARINNDVPGFSKLMRQGNVTNERCQSTCDPIKAKADAEFYKSLRNRFVSKTSVNDFRRRHFSNKTILGVHIRAGNGESGDFSERGRGIGNEREWLRNLCAQLLRLSDRIQNPIVFVATDTPSMVEHVRYTLQSMRNSTGSSGIVPQVVFVDQTRPENGSGVLFGEQGKVKRSGQQCLQGWKSTVMDMMILSFCDVIVAARPSSFSQSLPMAIALASDVSERQVLDPYCEVNPTASEIQCFRDFDDWCCHGRTTFSLADIQRYDYLRMPDYSQMPDDVNDPEIRRRFKVSERPGDGCVPRPAGKKQVCLPYDWSKFQVRPQVQPPAKGLLNIPKSKGFPKKKRSTTEQMTKMRQKKDLVP